MKKKTDTQRQDGSKAVEVEYEEGEAASKDKLESVKAALKDCLKERKEYLEGWQRANADLVNTRRSLEQEYKQKRKYAEEGMLVELLPILDSFDMAFAAEAAHQQESSDWKSGIKHIQSQLLSVLASHGITSFEPIGAVFNPREHESLESTATNNKQEDGKVVSVIQKGYRLNDRIIRPAKVHVASYTANA